MPLVVLLCLAILCPDRARCNYLFGAGGIADIGEYELADVPYTPRLLGRTREEAAMQIFQRQRLLERNAAAHIVPLVQDMMRGDGTKAAKHRAEAALYNAKHIADVIHTAVCLAADRFDGGAKPGDTQPLTEWLPGPMGKRPGHPYYVTGFLVNQAMDAKRNLHPLAFGGVGKARKVAQGFGTGAPFAIDYTLAPGGVYRRFTCRVGLHETAGADGEVAFAVLINGKEALRTKPLGPNDVPEIISIELPADKILRLSLVTIPTDPEKSLSNLAVWGDPTLSKLKLIGRREVAGVSVGQPDHHRRGKGAVVLDLQSSAAIHLAGSRREAKLSDAHRLHPDRLGVGSFVQQDSLARVVFLPGFDRPVFYVLVEKGLRLDDFVRRGLADCARESGRGACFSPGGRSDSSPAVHCRGAIEHVRVPKERLIVGQNGLRTFQSSLRDSVL